MKKHFALLAAGALLAVSGMAQAERSGEEVYNGPCQVCHVAGVAGAPKLDDKAAWAPRIATGIDALVNTVKTGKNAMPPKGTCMDCSDAEIRAAVEYMVSKAQ
ncbi:MAG: c-type cytochrome [Gammaproteobacteria bacterium SHHR-1]|uniref:c-type cytochrome n=1 Tax=Magnetovirga frankeli TaxID=947516 RepID=UPI001293AFF3|nr:cytochrome c5 family protein [gamma proteobacterium SS-5]